jgi:hypothetical protein
MYQAVWHTEMRMMAVIFQANQLTQICDFLPQAIEISYSYAGNGESR